MCMQICRIFLLFRLFTDIVSRSEDNVYFALGILIISADTFTILIFLGEVGKKVGKLITKHDKVFTSLRRQL